MKKLLFSFAVWAAIAALLLPAVTACTKNEAPAPSSRGVFVTVSAGLPETKSVAVQEESDRYVLHFTEGDRLFVFGMLNLKEYPEAYCLAGYLDLKKDSISPDGRHAVFSGKLTYYDYHYDQTQGKEIFQALDLVIPDYPNPLDACYYTSIQLIPGGSDEYVETVSVARVKMKDCVVESLEALMSSAVDVYGSYDKDSGCVVLNQSGHVIFDVENISGLGQNTWYEVDFYLENSDGGKGWDGLGQITSDGNGNAAFALSVDTGWRWGTACLYFRDKDGNSTFKAEIAEFAERMKTNVIYRVSREAVKP